MPANHKHADWRVRRARGDKFLTELRDRGTVFSILVSSCHAIRGGGREMRAAILDQPSPVVTDGHVVKVDWYRRDDLPVGNVDVVHGKERVDERNIGFDEVHPVVGERRLRPAVDGLLCLGTEVLHHGDIPSIHATRQQITA